MFYENDETFVNAQGFVKKTTKLIFRKKTKNNWQILRRISKELNSKLIPINSYTPNSHIFFNLKKINDFRNYVSFHYCTSQNLTNLNFYLTSKNKPYFFVHKNDLIFKQKNVKIQSTKLQYWLNDFFSGGKDNYSHNSLIMSNCSRALRSESSNFF